MTFPWRSLLTTVSSKPLFLAQMFASGAGALGVVMAATVMPPSHFTTFSLLTLISLTCVGAARALLFQPALIEARNVNNAHVHVRVALLGAAGSSVGFVAAAAIVGVREPLWLAILSLGNVSPVIAEWLRIRGMTLDHRWDVMRGDVLRLVGTSFGPLILSLTADAKVFSLFINLTFLPTILYLAYRLPSVTTFLSPQRHWRPASSQLVDYLIGQAILPLPLVVLAGLGSSSYIGGIRIAQTLLGPLNLVFAASTMNFLVDGATRKSYLQPSSLIRHGRRVATSLSLLSASLVGTVLLILTVTHFSFRGADNRSLIVGTLLVGALAVVSGFSGIDALIMRLLGHHLAATLGRAALVAAAAMGYVLGYVSGGVDRSLITGFACAVVAYPLAFVLPAATLYRRYR
jgi:hypothetical protein